MGTNVSFDCNMFYQGKDGVCACIVNTVVLLLLLIGKGAAQHATSTRKLGLWSKPSSYECISIWECVSTNPMFLLPIEHNNNLEQYLWQTKVLFLPQEQKLEIK